jgi:hypothetical protein
MAKQDKEIGLENLLVEDKSNDNSDNKEEENE